MGSGRGPTFLFLFRGEGEIALRKERTPEEYKKVLAINLEEVKRMARIIEDLLTLTRLDYRPEVFKFEAIDIGEFMREICEQATVLGAAKNIKITASLPQRRGRIKADTVHLRRLFFNLVDNAIKFTPSGGTVDITVKYSEGKARISVSDTGCGIAAEHVPRIFERFYRITKGSGEIAPGTGLGLSIAQSIAKLHGGLLEVQSTLTQGATFTALFPLL